MSNIDQAGIDISFLRLLIKVYPRFFSSYPSQPQQNDSGMNVVEIRDFLDELFKTKTIRTWVLQRASRFEWHLGQHPPHSPIFFFFHTGFVFPEFP